MSKLRRYHQSGNIYFITAVTYKRKPILLTNAKIFQKAIERTRKKIQFKIIAWVLMPDHVHLILDPQGHDVSNIIQRIKMCFGGLIRHQYDMPCGRVWQHRFWDHIIRDQDDLNRHIDYIHYNPVRHGYTKSPLSWEYSSMTAFADRYPPDWGIIEEISFEGDYGE